MATIVIYVLGWAFIYKLGYIKPFSTINEVSPETKVLISSGVIYIGVY